MQAAIALEHFTKARLAFLNPLLLAADTKHLPTLVWLADSRRHEDPFPPDLRTISVERALDVLYVIDPLPARDRESLDALRRARNAVVHMGAGPNLGNRKHLPPFLRALIEIIGGCEEEPGDVFGDYRDFALSQLQNHRDEEEALFAGRVAMAELRAASLGPARTATETTQLRQLVELRWHRDSVEDQLVDCTVCGLPSYVTGEMEHTGWDVDWEDGEAVNAHPVFEYRPSSLRCPTCGLILDTPVLVEMSGAMESWILSGTDYAQLAHAQAESDAEAIMQDLYERS